VLGDWHLAVGLTPGDIVGRKLPLRFAIARSAQQALLALVPVVTARTLAACRVLVCLVLAYYLLLVSSPQELERLASDGPFSHGFVAHIDGGSGVLTDLSASWWARKAIYGATAASLAAFIVDGTLASRILS
jgi:hypothetical protein